MGLRCPQKMDPSPLPETAPPWVGEIDRLEPVVLVLGGFLTVPFVYDRFSRRLRSRGARSVIISRVWLPDWLIATTRGLGTICTRGGRALTAASLASQDAAHGAPVLVIGHSAGGLVGRLLTASEPFPGRRFGAAARIGALVTLGSPHVVGTAGVGRRVNALAAAIADQYVPGTAHAPSVGYVSVASRAIVGDPSGNGQERVSYQLYRSILGEQAAPGTTGDGLVPTESALLSGARQIVLDTAVHGPGSGAPWYGADDQIDLWWPAALDAWRTALRARVDRSGSATIGAGDLTHAGRQREVDLEEAG